MRAPRPLTTAGSAVRARAEEALGGPARLRVIALLALVLALSGADMSTVGSAGPQLEPALGISNTEIGLLLTVSQLAAAVASLPMGILADHTRRQRVVWISILLWSLAMAASGAAVSYPMLLVSRIGLGMVTAAAGPPLVSLVGDFFPAGERGRIWGTILAGELAGIGGGVIVSGMLAAISWRVPFFALGAVSAAVAFAIYRLLPEPARGGQSQLKIGQQHIPAAEEAGDVEEAGEEPESGPPERSPGSSELLRAARAEGAKPQPEIVPPVDVDAMSWPRAIRYTLAIRTNLYLILASALGYFYLAGVQSFILILVRARYDVPQTVATLLVGAAGSGAILGVISGGRVADWLIRRGRTAARLEVGAAAFGLSAVFLVPALLSTALPLAAVFFFFAAAALGASNPPMDAARLDVVRFQLWGRAESVRSLLRTTLQAAGPLTFGALSGVLGGGAMASGAGSAAGSTPQHADGLTLAFLAMVGVLLVAGVMAFLARRPYPTDVVSASASPAGPSRS